MSRVAGARRTIRSYQSNVEEGFVQPRPPKLTMRLTRPLSLGTHKTKTVRYFFFFFGEAFRRIRTFWSVDCWRAGDPDIPAGTFALVRTDLGAAQHVILSSHRRNNYIHCGGKKKSRSALSGKALLVCTRFDVALRSPFVLCSFY